MRFVDLVTVSGQPRLVNLDQVRYVRPSGGHFGLVFASFAGGVDEVVVKTLPAAIVASLRGDDPAEPPSPPAPPPAPAARPVKPRKPATA
jgi:hypothetical protein